MTNQSIYSDQWIDIVFENRNKEYGAYQLRHENPRTTLKALGIGFLLITTLVFIPMLMNQFNTQTLASNPYIPTVTLVESSTVVFPPEKKPEIQTAAPLTQKKIEKPKTDVSKENLIDPKVTKAENAKSDMNTNEEAQSSTAKPLEGAVLGSFDGGVKGGTGIETLKPTTSDQPNNGTYVGAVLDRQPSFPGGMDKFYGFVAQNFRAPETQMSNTIKVFVSFVIEKDGSMSNIKVHRNPGYGLDLEAIRVLKKLKTKWEPGILNGKPVRTSYNLPIVVERK